MAWIARLKRWHRWHGLAVSLIVLTSAGSGLLHVWMSHTQAPPPPARPATALDVTQVTIAPSELPARLAIPAEQVVSVSLRPIAREPWYQVITTEGGKPGYVHGATGVVDPQADARYATQIAQSALGSDTVREAAYLTAFDQEYLTIFRILPVYRFDADDAKGRRVYVSTMTGSVTRATDTAKQREAWSFTYLHKWNFISNRTVRNWSLIIAMAAIMALAVSGVVLFIATRPRRRE